MTTQAKAAIEFLKCVHHRITDDPVFVSSLPNGEAKDREPGEKHVLARDLSIIERFIEKWDRKDRGLFMCVCTLRPGSTPDRQGGSPRCKANVSEISFLHADIDFKSIEISADEVLQKLHQLPCKPSIVLNSGHGFHAYWLLSEATLADEQSVARIEQALRLLADLIGGDLAVAEVSRLMRLPGTHNTKGGAWIEVQIIEADYNLRYELTDIEDMLNELSPVIARKVDRSVTPIQLNPFLAVAARLGFKPPIDVEQRLAGMRYQGAGDAAIHSTQLSVSAALLARGTPLDETIDALLAATRAAAGEYGSRWNWGREERTIRRMCEDWLRKNPVQAERREETKKTVNGGGGATVTDIREAKKAKLTRGNVPAHVVLGEAVIAAIKARGDDLMFTPKAAWRYVDGLWSMEIDGLRSWLDVELEGGCRALGIESANRVIGEARQWITRNPDLWRESVPWDAHGLIPTRSGLVDPETLQVTPARADHYCTWRVETTFDPAAVCPWWETMAADTFGDRPADVRAGLVAVLQEVLGAALIDTKPRALSKGLILQGGSNFGKSGLLEVCGGLFGDNPIATPLDATEGAHGLMAFTRRAPWVLHEAFDQRKWLFSSVVKAIVTGEPVSINIKNGPMLSARIKAPIFWGTNHPPQFREATKAIVNRLIIIECRREFHEGRPVGAAAEARRRGFDKPSSLVLATELPGVLNWAIRGLRAALARGYFELTDEIREAGEEIRRDSNLAAGFVEECIEFHPDRRISAPDFCAAFSVWWLENKGEDRSIPSNESIGRALTALGDGRIALKDLRENSRRYYGGVALNKQGLEFWKRAADAKIFEGKTASTSLSEDKVNGWIPETWDQKQSIVSMRMAAHRGRDSSSVTVLNTASENCHDDRTVTDENCHQTTVTEPVTEELSPTQVADPLGKPLF